MTTREIHLTALAFAAGTLLASCAWLLILRLFP